MSDEDADSDDENEEDGKEVAKDERGGGDGQTDVRTLAMMDLHFTLEAFAIVSAPHPPALPCFENSC